MKKIFYTFLLISPLFFISSCEEEVEEVETYSLIGLWNGISHLEVENSGYIDSITGLDVITDPYSYLHTFNSSTDSLVLEFSTDSMFTYYYEYYEEYGEMIFDADTESMAYIKLGDELILYMKDGGTDTATITTLDHSTLEYFRQSRFEYSGMPDPATYFYYGENQLLLSRME